jgi:hypothetical protein
VTPDAKAEGTPTVTPDAKAEGTPEVTPDAKAEEIPEATSDSKAEEIPEATPDVKEEGIPEAAAETDGDRVLDGEDEILEDPIDEYWDPDSEATEAPEAPPEAPPQHEEEDIPGNRCGPLFQDKVCNCAGEFPKALYCNERNGWCGDTPAHRDAQSSTRYDCVKPAEEIIPEIITEPTAEITPEMTPEASPRTEEPDKFGGANEMPPEPEAPAKDEIFATTSPEFDSLETLPLKPDEMPLEPDAPAEDEETFATTSPEFDF